MPKSSAITSPNLGLYYGAEPLTIPARGLQDGRNFRVRQGKLTNKDLGWENLSAINFGAPIMLVANFFIRGGAQKQIIATTKDIIDYTAVSDTGNYLNLRYNVGAVNTNGGNPAVITVFAGSPLWLTNGIKAGDFISFGGNATRSTAAAWFQIAAVTDTTLTLTGPIGGGATTNNLYTIRRTLTGTAADIWDSETFVKPDDGVGNDLFFMTNGKDPIMAWDGNATLVTALTNIGFTAKRLTVYKNMMIYANLIETTGASLPQDMINSDVGTPFAAGDLGTGLSEQFRVHDGSDEILEVETMGDNLVLYSAQNIVAAQFVGDPLIFIFRQAAIGVGPIAPRLVANFGDYHEFIGEDSQYLFDGVTVAPIGQQVWREVLRQRDAARQRLGFHHFDEENGDLIWAIPLTEDIGVGVVTAPPEEAFVEHYLEEVGERTPSPHSRRRFPFSASGFATIQNAVLWSQLTGTWADMIVQWNASQLFSAFPTNLAGDSLGRLKRINTVQTADGVALVSFVRFGRRPISDGRMRGLITRVYPFAAQLNATLNVTIRMVDHAGSTPAVIDTQVFDTALPEGRFFTVHYRRGRFFEVEFGTASAPWQLSGYDTDARPGGNR